MFHRINSIYFYFNKNLNDQMKTENINYQSIINKIWLKASCFWYKKLEIKKIQQQKSSDGDVTGDVRCRGGGTGGGWVSSCR